MAIPYLFLSNKIQRQIDWNGEEFTFIHTGEDEYHNPTEPVEISIKGIYHQSTSYQQKTSDTGSVTSTKPRPMILTTYDDGSKLSLGDTINLNGKDMFVTGLENVQELNVAIQISLEVNE